MKKYTFLLFLSALFSFDDNFSIFNQIFNADDWVLVNEKSDSLVVYKKRVEGIKIPIFKATMTTSVSMEGIMEAVLDADGQKEFLSSSHLKESRLLDHSIKDTTFLYQILDLPIISNRHYITKNYTDTIAPGTHYQLNWLIDSEENQELFSDFITDKSAEHGNPIFITDGLGSWELKKLNNTHSQVTYYVLIDPGGMIPDYLVSYANKTLGPDTVMAMVAEGARRSKKKEVMESLKIKKTDPSKKKRREKKKENQKINEFKYTALVIEAALKINAAAPWENPVAIGNFQAAIGIAQEGDSDYGKMTEQTSKLWFDVIREARKMESTSILFCIPKNIDRLSFKKLTLGPILILNNSELQELILKHNVSMLEPWMPSASEGDCDGDVCLNRIYRISIEHKGELNVEQILIELSDSPSVLYAEPDVARNIFNKRRSK